MRHFKVIVAQPWKQYVHQLLFALQKSPHEYLFYTTLWYKKEHITIRIALAIFPFFKGIFRKRYFQPLSSDKIRIWLLPEILRFLLNTLFPKSLDRWVFMVERMHDRHVSKELKNKEYDILIAYENSSLLSFREARKAGKITVLDLAQVHHDMISDLRDKYPSFRTVLKNDQLFKKVNSCKTQQNKFVDYFFVLSEMAKLSLLQSGVSEDKIYLLNLGFDPEKFRLKKSKSEGDFTVLFVGSVTRRKGVHLLIEAFKKLDIPGARLQIVGPAGDAADLVQRLPANAEYLPFLPHEQLVKYYQHADVFVFPSYLDSWAMVVLEAMACGTPVIISENTGSKDVVKYGGGFIVPVDDVNILVEKIRYLYHNPEIKEKMGGDAYAAAQNYTWEKYHTQVINALEDIVRRSSKVLNR